MYELSVFEKVKKSDYTVLPYEANKSYSIDSNKANSLGYSYKIANYFKDALPISSSKYYAVNAPTSSDGSYNYLNWRVLNHMYYRNAYDSYESWEGNSKRYTEKRLFLTSSIISAPYFDMGDGFRKGSIRITSNNLDLRDDSYNNIYDYSINSSSLVDSNYLDAYFGFQNLYHHTKTGFGLGISKDFSFESNTIGENLHYKTYNVGLSEGIKINNTGSGAKIDFIGTSFAEIPHYEQLSYELSEDFTISFWLRAPISQSNTSFTTNSIITKKSYTNIMQSGEFDVVTESGYYKRNYVSSSISYSPVEYYPYDLSIYNQTAGSNTGKILFKRSDGVKTMSLQSTSSINDGNYHHICVTKTNNLLKLYIDGSQQASALDVNNEPTNAHTIILGAEDKNGIRQYSGSIDELRFYSKAMSNVEISQSLANSSNILAYQTINVGNVFYRRGEVAITSPVKKYHNVLKNQQWNLLYKNKYIIYEYETLVKIKAGSFNKTMNPTSIQSPKSNLYLNDFTGSLSPYATTVGLYNKNFQLVAVAKFGRPLKMRDDVDINVIVRLDY